MAPEDTAHAILRTLVKRLKLRGGQGALLETVIQSVRSEGIDNQEFEMGLKEATDRGWLVHDRSNHWVRLTDAGFAAA